LPTKPKRKCAARTPRLPVAELPPTAYALTQPSVLQRSVIEHSVRRCTEVNERCIEMLVHAARHERQTFALVAELRDLFALTTPAARRRVAERTFLLVDMNFRDPEWWNAVRRRPTDPQRNPPWRGSFPRLPAIHLVRATLLLAWNGLRADPATACVLFGMTPTVAGTLTRLTLNEIDGIAQKHFRHIRARWDDRPAVWRKLLLAAQTDELRPMGELNLHALQLLAGELLVPARAP
jgi:hypothetical protein